MVESVYECGSYLSVCGAVIRHCLGIRIANHGSGDRQVTMRLPVSEYCLY